MNDLLFEKRKVIGVGGRLKMVAEGIEERGEGKYMAFSALNADEEGTYISIAIIPLQEAEPRPAWLERARIKAIAGAWSFSDIDILINEIMEDLERRYA